jgi:hypothetical protein
MPELLTESGQPIPNYEPKVPDFLDRTMVLYGSSGSGKSNIIKNALTELRGYSDQLIIISPTNKSNKSFDDWAPSQLIHPRLYLPPPPGTRAETPDKAALRFLRALWNRAEMMTSIYEKANQLTILESLYRRVRTGEGDRAIRVVQGKRHQMVAAIRRKYANDGGMIEDEIRKVDERTERMLNLIYKKYIIPQYEHLWEKKLNNDERYSLTYINFNPHIVLVLDDCAAEYKSLFNKEEFRLLFYQNRHNHITLIISVQDDTDLPKNLRKNAYVSVYVDRVACSSNFERPQNGFPKETKRLVTQDLLPIIYRVKYRVLIYIREDPKQIHFYWWKPPVPVPRMFGSKAMQALCNYVANEGGALDSDNPFFKKFAIDS